MGAGRKSSLLLFKLTPVVSENEPDIHDPEQIIHRIRRQFQSRQYRLTDHAEDEMVDEETGRIRLSEIEEALLNGSVLGNYPNANRGSCCLVYGRTEAGRPLHVVCTTAQEVLFVITVYQPTPPTWTTPTQRA